MSKIQFEIEFVIQASPQLLYQYMHTPSNSPKMRWLRRSGFVFAGVNHYLNRVPYFHEILDKITSCCSVVSLGGVWHGVPSLSSASLCLTILPSVSFLPTLLLRSLLTLEGIVHL